ncbi:disease resistance protein Roq1-like isoform X1 [Apium graveolens]|uniref:disease resistance protein Roq1-like isoform X1 n=1 Tax=Apium graveolens TaxID=4045 RepID=UPI003D7A298F
MASTSSLQITAPSSSSSSSPPKPWDVFLSFYGDDTRKNFTSHLYAALDQAGILTFRDDPALKKGQDISSGLLDAIRDSKMFVLIISENYARSPWCLKELVDILSCKKTENQVIPVFFYVDPSDVRHQKGTFGDALDYHYQKKRYSPEMIDEWKSALAQIAALSGYHLNKEAKENEAETIQKIVENIARKVSTKVVHVGEEVFGIDSAVEEIYQKLRMESNDVRAIGICGMGGIGKTTTAKAFYNKYHPNFDSCCFIENVKQYSQGGSPLLPLIEQLLTVLLKLKDYKVTDVDSGIRKLEQILRFKRTLIVLDDLDQSSYSEFLAKHCNLFSAGSRIVITSRNIHLRNQLKSDLKHVELYMVKELGQDDSLKLFNYHAFGEVTPPASLRELSVGFVTYAGGLPLALKVLGSYLRGRTKDKVFWKAKLEQVKKNPENKIMEILQLSYKELDEDTKSIFRDIAFFFVGKFKYEADIVLKSCDYSPEVGIPELLERCLLTIDRSGVLGMHDLIQDMGREVSKGKHLFLQENAGEYLHNWKDIEGLVLDLTQSTEKQINSQIFKKLPKLRLLEIRNVDDIKGHFKNSFQELRCIYWNYCTWTCFPASFRPQKLVSMNMRHSNFKTLWDDAMRPFRSLKMINVSYSVNLKTIPNFENSKSIERLYFRGCESLLNVHPSIRELTALYVLDLRECFEVKVSAETLDQLSALGFLYLGYCSNLRQLPKQLGAMKLLKVLDASYIAIEELPDSITQLKELVWLKLDGCKKLKKLPEQIGNMEGLRTFRACGTAIEQLPDSFGDLINLEILYLSRCENLRYLPNSLWKLTLLRVLNLYRCSKLKRLPDKLEKMQFLEELSASETDIEEVPDSIGLLSRLRILEVSHCNKLKNLPDSVWNLPSLTQLFIFQTDMGRINLPSTVNNTKLLYLSLKCDVRVWLPVISSFSCLKNLALTGGDESLSSTGPVSLSMLHNLQSLELYNCTNFGSSLPDLPLNISHLALSRHERLVHLPDLSSLKRLNMLAIESFIRLKSLSSLPPHLQSLRIYDCISLQHPSDVSMLKELSDLNFGMGDILKPAVSSFHQFPPSDKVELPKIAEWLGYKSTGPSVCIVDIPTMPADNFLGLALSVLFRSQTGVIDFSIKAVVTNQINGTTKSCLIPVYGSTEVCYVAKCIRGDEISTRSGDRINILLQRQTYSLNGAIEVLDRGVKAELLGAHVIRRTLSTPDFPSALNNLINTFPSPGFPT